MPSSNWTEFILPWLKLYYELGLSIVPVIYGTKKPALPWAKYQKERAHWELVSHWFLNGTRYNVGIVTGSVSGVVCLDRDCYRPGYDSSVVDLFAPLTLDTPLVKTPRGGWHQYFVAREPVLSCSSLGRGVELRAEGCLMIAPPSAVRIQGSPAPYTWVKRPDQTSTLPLPQELAKPHKLLRRTPTRACAGGEQKCRPKGRENTPAPYPAKKANESEESYASYAKSAKSYKLTTLANEASSKALEPSIEGSSKESYATYASLPPSREGGREETSPAIAGEASRSSCANAQEESLATYASLPPSIKGGREETSPAIAGEAYKSVREETSLANAREAYKSVSESEESTPSFSPPSPYPCVSPLSLSPPTPPLPFPSSLPHPLPPRFLPLTHCVEATGPLGDLDPAHRILGFDPGSRDMDLFRLAVLMFRGGASKDEVVTTLDRIMSRHLGKPDHEGKVYTQDMHRELIRRKVEAALSWIQSRQILRRAEELLFQERRLKLADIFTLLGVKRAETKEAIRTHLTRLPDVRSVGRGVYEVVTSELEIMRPWDVEDAYPLDVSFPLALETRCLVYPGNIVLLQGAKSAGKTAFLMNFVRMNLSFPGPIYYLNSEMGEIELANRLRLFGEDLERWKKVKFVQWYDPSRSFEDVLRQDPGGLYVVDFVEIYGEFWRIGEKILQVHRGLDGKGLAVVALQKVSHSSVGRGGYFSWEKPRLILDLDRDNRSNILTIRDCKAWTGSNPNGTAVRFKLVQGSKFVQIS